MVAIGVYVRFDHIGVQTRFNTSGIHAGLGASGNQGWLRWLTTLS